MVLDKNSREEVLLVGSYRGMRMFQSRGRIHRTLPIERPEVKDRPKERPTVDTSRLMRLD